MAAIPADRPHVTPVVHETLIPQLSAAIGSIEAALMAVPKEVLFINKCSRTIRIRPAPKQRIISFCTGAPKTSKTGVEKMDGKAQGLGADSFSA